MANVLPPDALKTVRNSHRARFILVGSLVSIACSVIAFLALLPAYAIVRGERLEQGQNGASAPASESADREDVARAQFLLKEFRAASSTASFIPMIEIALAARPAGITVTSIGYTRETGALIISGAASSRESINAYRALLAEDSRFKSVSVPIGALAGIGEGRFTMTLIKAL